MPPSVATWVTHMVNTLLMERYIYQHRGNSGKFERLWAPWLDTPGLSPKEPVMMRLLQCSTRQSYNMVCRLFSFMF